MTLHLEDHYPAALRLVAAANLASPSYLQRHLGIGWHVARALLSMMEREGVVSPLARSGIRRVHRRRTWEARRWVRRNVYGFRTAEPYVLEPGDYQAWAARSKMDVGQGLLPGPSR